jgi:hypothetical protein
MGTLRMLVIRKHIQTKSTIFTFYEKYGNNHTASSPAGIVDLQSFD